MIYQTNIPGIGNVSMDSGGWTPKLAANGQPGTKVGRTSWTVPTQTGGSAEVQLKGAFLDVYPSFVVDGTEYRTGPETDVATRILMFAPLITLFFVRGGIGFGVAMVGILTSRMIAMRLRPGPVRALAMLGVAAGAVVVAIGAVSIIFRGF